MTKNNQPLQWQKEKESMHSPGMKFHSCGSQGDVRFIRVPREKLPKEARKALTEAGRFVVAHSETGHHHVVDPTAAVLYETSDPFVAYLVLEGIGDAVVTHQKTGEHVHGPVTLKNPGLDWVWQVRRQREWQPEGLRSAAD